MVAAAARTVAPAESSWDLFHLSEADRDAQSLPTGRHVLLVPGALVPALPLSLPPKLTGATREAVARRQICDQLSLSEAEADMRPLSLGRQKDWSHILLSDVTALTHWRASASAATQAVLPDYLAVPAADQVWSVAASPSGDVAVRLGLGAGFSAPAIALPLHLDQLWRDATETDRPKALFCPPDLAEALPALARFAEEVDLPLCTTGAALQDLGLSLPKVLAHGELALDLRRDPSLARARLRARLSPWRWSVLALGLAAALWVAGQAMQIRQLNAATAQQNAANLQMLRQSFVPEGPVLDIRVQAAQVLDQRRQLALIQPEQGALDLLARAAPVLYQARSRGAGLSALRSEAAIGLELTLFASDFASLEQLLQDLRGLDLAVTLRQSGTVDPGGIPSDRPAQSDAQDGTQGNGQDGVRAVVQLAAQDAVSEGQ